MEVKRFNKIVKENTEKIYWTVRKIVINHEDANDITQEVFVKVWNSLDKFRQEAKISTWIHRIAINCSLDHLKKNRNKLFITMDNSLFLEEQIVHSESIAGEEIDLLLQKVLLTLPDKQRLVFNLKYFENKKYEEISKLTGTSIGALKTSYHLAVKKIKKTLPEATLL